MNKPTQSADFVAGRRQMHFAGQAHQYRSFLPGPVNRPYQWRAAKISVLLEEAVRRLGELNAYSALIPDVDFFIEMHVRSEAVKSSRIEGTKTGVDEAALPEDEIAPQDRDDWAEVQNYIRAMNHGIDALATLPVCMRLLCGAHKILMSGVRGENKQPGEVRSAQNWIGGASIAGAHFVPPHPSALPELLTDLEKFWHNRSLHMPHLIRTAISHYQFETIHPFNDGNGRIGRMLIVLHLIELGVLKRPTLYLSDFFERNKGAYYDALTLVRERNDLDQWLAFFLTAVSETADKGIDVFTRIISLREEYDERIAALGRRAKRARALMPGLFSSPAVTVSQAAARLQISTSAANTLINQMAQAGILREATGHSRNRVFLLHAYLNLFSA